MNRDLWAGGRTPAAVPTSGFRPELHGIRGLAITLVVLFHVFGQGRVSGGIDAFLAVSGFLITLSITRRIEEGTLSLTAYLARLLRRLLPPVLLVMTVVALAGYLWSPSDQRQQLIRELRATLFYTENWELIASRLDYAVAGPGTSPLQHFWSLSVQGQFYLLWFVLLAGAAWVGRRIGWSVRTSVLLAVSLATVGSFLWHVLWLSHDQQVAYLHTGGRIWELGLGGLVALWVPPRSAGKATRVVLGWVGVALLVSCGFVLDGKVLFPGPWALWPVGGVLLVLVAGTTGARVSADRVLQWAPFRFLADVSYAWYLWHWPLLIFALQKTGKETADALIALGVVSLSLLLAWGSTRLLEQPLGRLLGGRKFVTLGATVLILAVAAGTSTAALLTVEGHQRERLAAAASPSPQHPGAAALAVGWDSELADVAPVPNLSVAIEDKPTAYQLDGCVNTHRDTPESAEPGLCHIGPQDARHTVLVMGGSHVTQWMPALQLIAEQEGWQLAFTEKGGCQFLPRPGAGSTDPPQTESCYQYNENLWPLIEELDPDFLFTLGTTSRPDSGEATPDGFVDTWRRLEELDITVLAMRDTTRFQQRVPECLERTGLDAHECGQARTARLREDAPILAVAELPHNVHPMDVTDYICDAQWCPAIQGNVLVYRDTSHITGTYMRSLAPFVRDELRRVAPELF